VKIEFLAPAESELNEAIVYYNHKRSNLGFEFSEEVKRTLERILQYPEAWSSLSKRTRQCTTKKFPYNVIYQIRSEKILIIAVMHQHRNPETWRSRIHNQ